LGVTNKCVYRLAGERATADRLEVSHNLRVLEIVQQIDLRLYLREAVGDSALDHVQSGSDVVRPERPS
jgi:hypothetical protein